MTPFKYLKNTVAAHLIAGLVLACTSGVASAQEKYASIVINAETDEVLHARFADARRYPASLTKVMTLYMLFDAIEAGDIRLSERLRVSATADRQPASDLGVKAGSTIKVEDAIYALVTKSANDVAVVVAERIGGTEERFSTLMTVKARALGLTDTSFFNASGLPDERQVTTARDMAKLAEALLENHGDYYHYFSNPRFSWGRKTYRNHNKLLGSVDGVDGIKTGYTRASGFNLMASAKRDNTRIIAIMLGGTSSRSRNTHVAELIEAAYTSLGVTQTPDSQAGPQIAFAPSSGVAVSRILSAGAHIGATEAVPAPIITAEAATQDTPDRPQIAFAPTSDTAVSRVLSIGAHVGTSGETPSQTAITAEGAGEAELSLAEE